MQDRSKPTFAGLLRSAVEEPGTLSSAYQQFHSYSLGNQLLAMFQCQERDIPPGSWPPTRSGKSWGDTSAKARRP